MSNGIGSWSDARSSGALVEGMRPDHGRLAGVPLAAIIGAQFLPALLPDDLDAIVAYLRHRRAVRNQVPDPVYKAPVHRGRLSDAEAGFDQPIVCRSGQARRLSRHHRPLHGVPLRPGGRPLRLQNGLGRGGRVVSAAPTALRRERRPRRRQHHVPIPTAGIGGWSDQENRPPITHGIAATDRPLKPPMAFAYYGVAERSRSRRYHRLSAHVPPLQ